MALITGYYNSLNGDRKYNAETMSKYFSGLFTRGVLQNYKDKFVVQASTGMNIKIPTGKAYFSDGKWIENNADIILAVDPSDVVLDRIDRVVLRNDKSEAVRNATVVLKKGTPASNPTAPELTNDEYIEEMALADIRINKLVESITQGNITNTIPNTELCGYVTGLIDQVDTTDLYLQYQAAYEEFRQQSEAEFDEWFDNVRDQLSTSTLLREYTMKFTTTQQDQTDISLEEGNYNYDLDILEVYVNGLKLINDIDYVNHETYITLTKPLDINNTVEIVIMKSVDGYKADTVIKQVETLNNEVAKLTKYIYYATGENDNVKLSEIANNYYNASAEFAGVSATAQIKIEVIGNLGVTTPDKGTGTTEDPYIFFDFTKPENSTRKLIFDFTATERMSLGGTEGYEYVIFGGNDFEIRGMRAVLGTGSALYGFNGTKIRAIDCELYLNGTETAKVRGCLNGGTFINTRISVTSGNSIVVGLVCNNSGVLKAVDCEILAYNNSGASEESIGILVEASNTEAVLIAERCNIPLRTRNGYKQSQTIKVNSGYCSLVSNVLGKAPALYSTDTSKCSNVGTLIISK